MKRFLVPIGLNAALCVIIGFFLASVWIDGDHNISDKLAMTGCITLLWFGVASFSTWLWADLHG